MTILLFPGQGSQKVGMTRDLAERFPVARETLELIDEALGTPLTQLMWEGPEDELTLTHNAQPAILAHSAAVLSVIRPALGEVVAAAGHSLGEYSAWVASGALGAADAAVLVRRRGTLMYEAGRARPGAMAAVLGLGTAEVEAACAGASAQGLGVAVAANQNAPDQTVISGDPAAVERAGELCKAAGAKRVLPLKVSGAFHSPLMEPAVPGLVEALGVAPFGTPTFPVVANATADFAHDTREARQLLGEQLTAPVRWVESMRRLAGRWPEARWLEIGPGSVLTGLLKRIAPEARCTPLGTVADLDTFLAA
ncbi:MAG TPA: ACP S-malonyltransferase [Gemmatimonadales bacterium]|nr:ACP S-malonyltransferase [Gemmatimonadales bacterium]